MHYCSFTQWVKNSIKSLISIKYQNWSFAITLLKYRHRPNVEVDAPVSMRQSLRVFQHGVYGCPKEAQCAICLWNQSDPLDNYEWVKTIEIGSFEKNVSRSDTMRSAIADAFCELDWQVWEKKGFTVNARWRGSIKVRSTLLLLWLFEGGKPQFSKH